MTANPLAGCWILSSRPHILNGHYQRSSVFLGWCKRSFSGWLYPSVDGHGMLLVAEVEISCTNQMSDCLDLLLRLDSSSLTSRLHRFLRPPQRTTCVSAQQPANESALPYRHARNNAHRKSCTPNVHISATQWL